MSRSCRLVYRYRALEDDLRMPQTGYQVRPLPHEAIELDRWMAEVSCDGEVTGYLEPGQKLRVEAAAQRVELIHPSGYDYYEILRNKLYWGRGNRKSLSNL